MSSGNTLPPKTLPALGYYASEYAFSITNLSIISADNEIDFLNLSVTEVDDSISPADANYLESNLSILDTEIDDLEQASTAVATLGKKWLEDASKHPADKHDAEVQKKTKLDADHDAATIRSRAAARLRELKKARSKLSKMCTEARKIVEGRDVQQANQRGSFPGPMGAFGATAGSFAHGAPRTAKVAGTSGGGGDDTGTSGDPDASAYNGSFFVNGELERLIGSTPASSKPLKLVGQAIEKFDGDITNYPVFRQQFLREAHRPGRDTDDVDRFYFLLSLLDGPAKQLVSGIKPLKGCYQLATSTLDQRYGDENEIYRQLLRELKQVKPLQHGCSATQIEQFSMKVVQTLGSIADLGRADTSGRTFEEIEEKLPSNLREKIHERKRLDPHWDITKLHAFLLERAATTRAIHGDKVRPEPPDVNKVKTSATSAQQRFAQNKTRPPPRKDAAVNPKCVFCPSTAHWGSHCPVYATLISRISRILELKRCYVCLNEHSGDSCRNPAAKDSRLCNERHHICFCPERYRTEKKASKTHATTLSEVYEDYEEPVSDSFTEDEASTEDQANADDEIKKVHFQDDNAATENHTTHAVLSNQNNGSHQSTLLECV